MSAAAPTTAGSAPGGVRVRRLGLPLHRPGLPLLGAGVLVAVLVLGVLLPIITGYKPNDFVDQPQLAPSGAHPFGTDQFGRDVLVRTFAAARIDYLVAFVTVGFSALVGTLVGVFATASPSRTLEWAIMRLADAVISFPFTVLVLALVVAFGTSYDLFGLPRGLPALFMAVAITGWAYYARLARSETLSLRRRDFVVAARLMGYRQARIVCVHLLPTVLMTTLAYAVGDAVVTVSLTASLSFLGAGVPPPTPEWGQMMFEGRDALQSAWWVVLFPALGLIVSGLAMAAVADGLIRRLSGRS